MHHFVVEIRYNAHIDEIAKLRPAHREFLDTLYTKGIVLMSGPQTPQIGGIIIARAESMEELAEILKNDPYQLNNAAEYIYIQFDPRNYQKILEDWIGV
ncbi:MAG: YciI family protein [Melioribacteraceae bacterium]|nr:YciI family protein [Melioribacteraceae bacterium]